MAFVLGTHVRSLATHYDEGIEDETGATYSQRLATKGVSTLSLSFHLVPTLDDYGDAFTSRFRRRFRFLISVTLSVLDFGDTFAS
jgi:hypothetical protein